MQGRRVVVQRAQRCSGSEHESQQNGAKPSKREQVKEESIGLGADGKSELNSVWYFAFT